MNNKNQVYQFKVSLRGISPPIWRRIQVPQTYSFWDLHVALQDALGWLDYHLHLFHVMNPKTGVVDEIGIPDDEPFADEHPCLPGWEVPLTAYFVEPGTRAHYEYDFGDSWEHDLLLEELVNQVPKQKYPICLQGKRACPPEDCGGIWGYEQLLQTIRDPSDEEYESTMVWLGGSFDPEAFDPKKVRFDDPYRRWHIAIGGS
ncbi:MAG: plasmid pRiA4b ORF-3 family protein [bacterium]